ncbi:AbrB family transcriptional regulator [Oscillibacter sp.]|uniref:AbrB family transcriptional regulator n=1 Tax=Oscillibacter sp. TaxID=1945593 RepID=UPI0026118D96|nr:AbrB family transcriptional regulator [Oscillibacter sp.]MDD3347389.1 AbrB family transcriptional regulator [Oscillibacter sp.]
MTTAVFTLAVSAAVGWCFQKAKVPAGMMIGAVVAAAVLTAAFRVGYVPPATKSIAQVIAGAFIGCSASRSDLQQLRVFYKPVLIITASLLTVNVVIGFLLFATGYSDLLTCLICAVPGGITDVTLIAVDLGADASKVLVIHFCRLIVGLVVFPLLVQRFTPPLPACADTEADGSESDALPPRRSALHLLVALAVAAVCGWVGNWLKIPAGIILFSLLGSFALKFCGFRVNFPSWLRRVAQVLSGAYVGCLLDPTHFGNLTQVFWAALITLSVLLVNAITFGKLLKRLFQIPLREGMLMLTPAGASDMALISADIGVNSPRLILVQIYRMLIATAIFPQLCLLLASAI